MKYDRMRKIAANYIFLPGFPLIKNGYVIFGAGQKIEVRDTGGIIREFAGLEFYGGMIVAGYVYGNAKLFIPGRPLLPVLEDLYRTFGEYDHRLAILEGAELRNLTWTNHSRVRYL